MLLRSFLHTVRTLQKNRWQTLINLFGLTLGIAACLSIGFIIRYEMRFDESREDRDQIYQVGTLERFSPDDPIQYHPLVWPAFPEEIAQKIPGISSMAAYHQLSDVTVRLPAQSNRVDRFSGDLVIADSAYFSILKSNWLSGNPLTSLNNAGSAVISRGRAHVYFGSLAPDQLLGKTLLINDTLLVHITGVVEDQTTPSDFTNSLVISAAGLSNPYLRDLLAFDQKKGIPSSSRLLIKRFPDVDVAIVNQDLQRVFNDRFRTANVTGIRLLPLKEVHFTSPRNEMPVSHLKTLYFLGGTAAFVLLLAIINYINLTTAQALSRTKELAIRKTLGATRRALAGQLVMETVVLALISTVLALLISPPLLRLFPVYVPVSVNPDWSDPWTLLIILGVVMATILLSALYPAISVGTRQLSGLLNEQYLVPTSHGSIWRKSLIAFQFFIAILFITTTLGMRSQLRFMETSNTGFESSGVIMLETDDREHMDQVRLLQQKIKGIPGVLAVAKENMPPMGPDRGLFQLEYKGPQTKNLSVVGVKADEHFVPLYHIPLLAGKNLVSSDTLREVLINETLSRSLGFVKPQQAIGKQLLIWEKWVPIVGVVKDFHQDNFRESIRPGLILDLACADLAVKLESGNAGSAAIKTTIQRIEAEWKRIYPQKPFVYSFLSDSFQHFYDEEKANAVLVEAAAGVTILISCIGIFGLTLYSTERRKKELAIRQILGAQGKELFLLIGKDFFKLIILAVLVAGPLSWYCLHRWLNNFAYRSAGSVWAIGEAVAIAYFLVLATIGLQLSNVIKSKPASIIRQSR